MVLNHIDEPLAEAEQLLANLNSLYSDFAEGSQDEARPATKKITQLFAKWFTGFNPLSANPDQQAFLDEVQRIVEQLAALFKDNMPAHSDACMSTAAKAVSILLPPRLTKEKTAADWSLTAAEYHISVFLPYLSQKTLGNLRATLLERTPKRLMLPKQLELLKMIDNLIRR